MVSVVLPDVIMQSVVLLSVAAPVVEGHNWGVNGHSPSEILIYLV